MLVCEENSSWLGPILVCQSKAAEERLFTFLHDPFMEVTGLGCYMWKNCEKTGPTSVFHRLYPPLHSLYALTSLTFITSLCSALYRRIAQQGCDPVLQRNWRAQISRPFAFSSLVTWKGQERFAFTSHLQKLVSNEKGAPGKKKRNFWSPPFFWSFATTHRNTF